MWGSGFDDRFRVQGLGIRVWGSEIGFRTQWNEGFIGEERLEIGPGFGDQRLGFGPIGTRGA